jgi:hypothetical protein
MAEIGLAMREVQPRSDLSLQGLFVLSVATFEVALVQTLRYYLRWLPQKLPETNMSRDDLLPGDALDAQVERHLLDLAYKGKQELLQNAIEILSISDDSVPNDLRESLAEVNERRNLLLHNGLVVNDRYRERLGITDAPYRGAILKIDDAYLDKALRDQQSALEIAGSRLQSKYARRTFVAAVKTLWEFTLDTPMAKFDDWWIVDEARDRIMLKPDQRTRKKMMLNLSHSERMFMGMWMAHYLGRVEHLDQFSMTTLGGESKSRMLFFLSVVGEMYIGRS